MTLLLRRLPVLFFTAIAARAQPLLPLQPIPLDSLTAFQSPAANWQITGEIAGDPRSEKTLAFHAGTGVLANSPTAAAHADLITAWEHADLELDFDFLLPADGRLGVLLQGRYSVPLDEKARPALRAPGLWQHLHVEFQAPRFDAAGRKTKNARFAKVVLNDFVIHENAELAGPAREAAFPDEKPSGPLVIQGDPGPLALRRLSSKPSDPATRILVENLAYKLYAGAPGQMGDYDAAKPTREGTPASFAPEAVERSSRFSLVFTGNFVVPADGTYAFGADTQEPTRLLIDGQPAITPLEQGGLSAPLALTRGRHAFRVDFLHGSARAPALQLIAEGPGLAPQTLTAARPRARPREATQLLIEPGERIRLQRSFVPFDPKKRLYAINVGTPAGVHYAYDFETGSLLRLWRGHFLDTFEMWDGRGENQIAKPAGPAITLNAKPTVALLERSASDWPDAPEPLWTSQGYTLEPDGQPVFLATLASLTVRDRIAPLADGRGLTRTLHLQGKNTDWQTWVLLAEASTITPQPDGHGYIVGDRSYYLDLPADSAVRPFVRTRNGRQQLVLPIGANAITKPIVYSLVW